MVEEGVIKFRAEHEDCALDPLRFGDIACQLGAWREVFSKLQLVGQEPHLYGGAGYGNISARVGPVGTARGARPMLISGTQTAGLARVGLANFCVVDRYNYENNWVRSRGQCLPSSETMTHGAIYDLSPAIRFVFHAHSPIIWRQSNELSIPTSDPSVPYGTPRMASEAQRLYFGGGLSVKRIMAMGGHEDGIIAFGQSAEETGQTLVAFLARAFERVCRA